MTTMSTSSGCTPLALKSCISWPHGTSGASAGLGPRPVSIRIVRPPARIRYEPRLKRTLCSCRCDSYSVHSFSGMVGKKLHRSNSSIPSDSWVISTSPTRITLLAMVASPAQTLPLLPLSRSEIGRLHQVRAQEISGATARHQPAPLQHVGVVGHRESASDVLFNEENGDVL